MIETWVRNTMDRHRCHRWHKAERLNGIHAIGSLCAKPLWSDCIQQNPDGSWLWSLDYSYWAILRPRGNPFQQAVSVQDTQFGNWWWLNNPWQRMEVLHWACNIAGVAFFAAAVPSQLTQPVEEPTPATSIQLSPVCDTTTPTPWSQRMSWDVWDLTQDGLAAKPLQSFWVSNNSIEYQYSYKIAKLSSLEVKTCQ